MFNRGDKVVFVKDFQGATKAKMYPEVGQVYQSKNLGTTTRKVTSVDELSRIVYFELMMNGLKMGNTKLPLARFIEWSEGVKNVVCINS
jgi:hypothetical protein